MHCDVWGLAEKAERAGVGSLSSRRPKNSRARFPIHRDV